MRNVLESEDVVSMCWGVESTLAVIGTRGPIKWSNICEDVVLMFNGFGCGGMMIVLGGGARCTRPPG